MHTHGDCYYNNYLSHRVLLNDGILVLQQVVVIAIFEVTVVDEGIVV